MPRLPSSVLPRPRRLWIPLAPSVIAATLAAASLTGAGCDEKLQTQLKNASERQAARDAKKAEDAALRERGLGPADAISPEIARAIKIVRTSDYDFVVRKGKVRRAKDGEDVNAKRYSGFDFASTLESKTRWLGRGVTDLETWLDQIGSSTFFAGDAYLVRLPDGREMSFRTWLHEEFAALPPDVQETPEP